MGYCSNFTTMLVHAVTEFFKYKVVGSIIVLSCWPGLDQIKLSNKISKFGLSSTFSCDPSILDDIDRHRLQGVLYITNDVNNDVILQKVDDSHFMPKYKWLILGDRLPDRLQNVRYDADVTFLKLTSNDIYSDFHTGMIISPSKSHTPITVHFEDVYIHPRDGVAVHPWAYWTASSGLHLTHDRQKILRRQNLKKYPLRIATPHGHYSSDKYNGTLLEWINDESVTDQDAGILCAYPAAMLLTEAVNGQDVILVTRFWATTVKNDSMVVKLAQNQADLSGGIYRILVDRIEYLDFVLGIWPYQVGFTYLAERESSTNMYLEPFSPGVWWACLVMMGILALVQRITSKGRKEQDGAFYTVLTTYLQQDASAVPEGISGRWAFTVLSVSAMLVHAYYTSAIVSALMSTGRGGPDSLKALADSKYAIASEDFDYMRYALFDAKTTWDEMEYLKKKKKTSKFYQEIETGVELIRQGSTAFHTEYNQIYPLFKTFTDDQICKLQQVDTIPETLSFITSPKNSQFSNIFRVAGAWLTETGLGKRLVSRVRIPKPPCRAALLAERVNLGDVTPLLLLTLFGGVLSFIILGMEIMFAKTQRNRGAMFGRDKKLALVNEENVFDVVEYDVD